MTNKVHQTFYAEFTDDPKTWASPRPAFDADKFNKELERRAGTIGSVPRFRLRWAGNLDEYLLENCFVHTGYTYIVDGKEVFVLATQLDFEFPDGAVVAPFHETHKIFTPRWVIEEYKEPFYEKAWMVELVEKTGEEYGRVDLLSHYREPSERDIQMAEHLNHLRETLNDDDIRNGIERMNALEAKEKQERRAEMIDEIAEDVCEALTDGILAKPIHFDINPNFNANERVRQIIQDGKI